jgi:four helix bundle protein
MQDRPIRSYSDLLVWQKAMALVTEIYEVTSSFPTAEMFGLTSQIRQAAVSIPSNIAEGQGRSSTGEFRQFLGHARGSLAELETQLYIAKNLRYLTEAQLCQLSEATTEVGRLLNGLMAALKNSTPKAAARHKKA